jgi:Arabinose-binding domain of AraC transcription regulator, N-term
MDAAFASFVELGRRGAQKHVQPKRVELKRPPEPTGVHEDYFKCPVRFRARVNALVLRLADLDLPFVSYNAELLEMLEPQLAKALAGRQAQGSIGAQVKWILKRLLAGNRPDILAVARPDNRTRAAETDKPAPLYESRAGIDS